MHPLDIDDAFRVGQKHRSLIVVLVQTTTQQVIMLNKIRIKRGRNCQSMCIKEDISDEQREVA